MDGLGSRQPLLTRSFMTKESPILKIERVAVSAGFCFLSTPYCSKADQSLDFPPIKIKQSLNVFKAVEQTHISHA